MRARMGLLAAMLFTLAHPTPTRAQSKHAGHIHSVQPSTGILVLAEWDDGGDVVLREVDFRGAQVVRLQRNPLRPQEWVERVTLIHRLPSETYVVVIGTETPAGVLRAIRIEAPVPVEEESR